MANTFKKFFAMLLALCLCVGMAPQAIAAATQETETTEDGGITTTVTTTTETTVNGDTTSVDITIETEKDGINEDGEKVEYDETYVDNTDRTPVKDGVIVDNEWSVDGKEVITSTEAPKVETDIPLTDEDDPETEEIENEATATDGDPAGTSETVDNIPEADKNGNNSDNTTTTTTQQGKVTVTTSDITITESVDTDSSELDPLRSDVKPTEDNDLFKATETDYTKLEVPEEAAEGYQYVYMGTDAASQFYAGRLFTSPGFDGEKPVYTDKNGVNYYTRRNGTLSGSFLIEGAYIDGEKESDEKIQAIWANIAQYVLVDPETGKTVTTYCADVDDAPEDLFSYVMKNIEDAPYYDEEQAKKIRTVAKNGYWGISDKSETAEAEYGSLEAVKEMMKNAVDEEGNRIFTDDEIASLSEGAAMTATQYAIWTFSNHMDDMAFLNVHYIQKNENNESNKAYSYGSLKDVPEGKEETVDVLFKLYEYLIALPGTELEGTTADTVINAENFLKEASITVVEKAKDHENNKDEDDTNDAYVTNINFALIVKPSTENGDELVVQIIGQNGETLATGRIAGEPKEGETVLVPDENGNYTFSGITLVEGEHNINISLSGVQNLKEGVYLYTSEVRGEETSQTMIGIAAGEREVSVEMDLVFELDVDDKVIVRERVWHDEGESTNTYEYPPKETPPPPSNDPPSDPPSDPPEGETPPPPSYDPPTEEIPDEPVPLANVPGLGDESNMWLMIAAFAFIGFVALNLPEKKREED